MAHRAKRSHRMNDLVSRFEMMVKHNETTYFDEDSFLLLIDHYEREENFSMAIYANEVALNQYSYCVEFYVCAARLHFYNGDVPVAREFVDRAAIISPNNYDVMVLDVKVLASSGEQDAALHKLSICKKMVTGMEKVNLYLTEASIHESMKDYDLMFGSLAKALRLDPKNGKVLEKIWTCTELTRKYEESIALHEEILDMDAYNYLAWYNLGQAYSANCDYVEAINAIEYSFVINEDFEIGYMDAGELCCQVTDYTRALHIFMQAEQRFGLDEDLYLSIIYCFIELGEFKKAKKYLIRALKQEFYNDEFYYYIGLCFMHENRLSNAITAFQKAIKLHDRREEYYCELAKAYAKNGELAKAHFNFRKATETGPDDEQYWIQHIQFLLQLGKEELALDILDEAEIHAVGAALSYCKAAVMIYVGEVDKGLEVLEDALIEDPSQCDVLFQTNPLLVEDLKLKSMVAYYDYV